MALRKTEQRLWDRMRRALTGRVRVERVENVVGEGTPDVLLLKAGCVTWCELKAVEEYPVRQHTRVLGDDGLNVAQRNWHLDWARWGGFSIIVVGVADDLFVLRGELADEVNDMSRVALAAAAGARDWAGLLEMLE